MYYYFRFLILVQRSSTWKNVFLRMSTHRFIVYLGISFLYKNMLYKRFNYISYYLTFHLFFSRCSEWVLRNFMLVNRYKKTDWASMHTCSHNSNPERAKQILTLFIENDLLFVYADCSKHSTKVELFIALSAWKKTFNGWKCRKYAYDREIL